MQISIRYLQFVSFSDMSLEYKISLVERTMRSIAKPIRLAQVAISYYGITKKIRCLISVGYCRYHPIVNGLKLYFFNSSFKKIVKEGFLGRVNYDFYI
jgi:hypothetical protein